MTPEEKLAIVRASLKKMFLEQKYFDICTIRSICDLCDLLLPREVEAGMRALHCMRFADMEEITRKWISAEIDRLFTDPSLIASNHLPKIAGAQIRVISPSAAFLFTEVK